MTQSAARLRVVEDPTAGPPPYDADAERAVLSAVMVDATALPKIQDFLRADHFYPEPHRRMFEACVDLFKHRSPIDVATVGAWLHARSRLEQVGGPAYLIQVADGSPAVHNVRAHAVAVHDMWRRRKVIESCHRTAAVAHTSVESVQVFCDGTTKLFAGIGMQNPLRPIETNREALERILHDATNIAPQAAPAEGRSVPTGIHSLDKLIFGLRRKAKTTIAATTGVGKTALAIQIAKHVASLGVSVLFFSTELTREELLRRAVSSESDVPAERIKRKELARHEVTALFEACNRINALPLRIDETARLTAEQLRAATAAYAEESMLVHHRPLGVVVVDYAQRLAPSHQVAHREEREQIAHATRELKIMSQELDVAVLELAQGTKPDPRDKRGEWKVWGSTVIAKESDEVIFMVPDESADPEAPTQEVELRVTKQRDGRKGSVRTIFRRTVYRFDDPNAPNPAGSNPSRQYVDDGARDLTEGL